MNRLLLSFIFLLCSAVFRDALAADTLHVVTHKKVTVVTDPVKGYRLYKAWGVFPSSKEPVRKIILRLQLACPNEFRCADWDYKDHITIRRKGGQGGPSQDFEIGRMLTPYGGAFRPGWAFNWEVDITDFSSILRDSVEIEYNHNGYEPNQDRGWSVTLDFEIIKGSPALEPISITKIYDGSYDYGDSNSIEKALKPVQFVTADHASFARLRVVQTGHGMDEPDNCAEFCNRFREIWYDGKLIDLKNIWKPCGDNPLYPQAGTWLFDRANWCPGTLMQPDLYDLPTGMAGVKHTVDINMQQYRSTKGTAQQVISAYLIQYRKPARKYDAEIVDVIVPSLKDAYKRINPAAFQPRILVKNNGSSPLRSLDILYGTKGFNMRKYSWKGELAPLKSTEIVLPGTIDTYQEMNLFEVKIEKCNGRKDEYPQDNHQLVSFQPVPKVDSMLVIALHTNKEASDNGFALLDEKGKTIFERKQGTLSDNTFYNDTIQLKKGRYVFILKDTAGNGLEFWANPKGGYGKARLLNGHDKMICDIESDFGSVFQYAFEVGEGQDSVLTAPSIGLYPTRTMSTTTLDYFANEPKDVTVQLVTDPGDNIVEYHTYNQLRSGKFTYDLSRFPKGRFYLKVFIDGQEIFKKRIRLKE